MSLEETKHLLRAYRITPNKLLGQNFMVDASVYPKLARYAELSVSDVVLDAGAGLGFLTRFLSNRCKQVIAVEKDTQVVQVLCQRVQGAANIIVIEGDILKINVPPFNKAISIPPYYLSSQLVLWLLDRGFDAALLIIQQEFADRLVAKVGSEEYGWLTVATYMDAQAELLDAIPKWMFYPQPQVDSIIVRLRPWAKLPFKIKNRTLFRRLAKWLFTQRNKKLGNAVEPFIRTELKVKKEKAKEIVAALPKLDWRVRDLSPEDFGAIADALTQ